jgi:hypothetical protein
MDRSDEIEQLTTQLRNVSLRLAQLEAAASPENNRSSAGTAAAPSSTTTAAAPSSAETAAALSSATTRAAAPIIQKGDRLRITNKVNKPRNWPGEWDQDKAQKATVTHFYRGQVHFITDNGVRTWQAVNNLAKEE